MPDINRPLSPHLSAYRWRITSSLSILHRASGVFLSIGAILLVGWLIAVASGAEAYDRLYELLYSIPGHLLLFGISAGYFYHLMNGIRHLFWDAGLGFELETAQRSGWAVVIGTIVLTFGFWALLLG